MSRSFQKASTASSSSGNPARVETSENMDADSSGSLAEELADDVEHRDRDHGREVHTQPGGGHAPQRAPDGVRGGRPETNLGPPRRVVPPRVRVGDRERTPPNSPHLLNSYCVFSF